MVQKFPLVILLFTITALDCQAREAASPQRVLGLSGAENFRDFGGYETSDDQTVKWGLLYRSNQLNRLTTEDYRRVNRLDIKLVADFRDEGERAEAPTDWQGEESPRFLPLPMASTGTLEKIQQEIDTVMATDQNPTKIQTLAIALYAKLPFEHGDKYGQLLQEVADSKSLPLLIHCAAGKDRTGVGAALILSALGVPRKTIIEDFLLSNQYPLAQYAHLPESYKPFLSVDRAWLEATFNAIEERDGSVDVYLKTALDIDAKTKERIRTNLLQ
ncbi:MAG: tyrosine-protein phosphatase [Pseudomonadales bacterium]